MTYGSLIAFGVHYIIASVAGSLIGIAVAFLLQARWVFRQDSRGRLMTLMIRHVSVYFFQICFSLSVLYFLIDKLGIDPIVAFALTATVITPLTFIVQKKFTFLRRGQ
jgi:putative flippase GtrA